MKTVWSLNKMNYKANYFSYELFENLEDAKDVMNKRKDSMIKAYDLKLYYGSELGIDLCSEDGEVIVFSMWIREDVIH